VKITETEEKQIEELIESLIERGQERNQDSLWFRLDLRIVKGNISVLHS
jgi:hypothetical protein